MNALATILAVLLMEIADALDRTARALRRFTARLPRSRLPPARLIVIGGRRAIMMDDRPEIVPVDEDPVGK